MALSRIVFIFLTWGIVIADGSGKTGEPRQKLEIFEIPPSEWTARETRMLAALPKVEALLHRSGNTRELHRIERDAMIEELREVSGSDPVVLARDEYYHIPAEHSTKQLIKWFETLLKKAKVEYRPEAWDCDDYSLGLMTFGEIAAGHDYDLAHGFAWANMIVRQKSAWSGVSAGGMHELVLVHTHDGFWVIEPQNGQHVSLQKYPNRENILLVHFN